MPTPKMQTAMIRPIYQNHLITATSKPKAGEKCRIPMSSDSRSSKDSITSDLSQAQCSSGNEGAHKYFTQIPNVIFHIGWKANKIAVYLAIKRTAGELGASTKSGITLAQEAGVSEKIYKSMKKELAEVDPILGVPLIRYQHRKKEKNNWDTDRVEIVDIWDISMEFIVTKIQKKEARGGVENDPTLGSKTTPKEEPIKEEPKRKQQQEKDVVVVPTLEKEKREALAKYPLSEATIQTLLKHDLKRITDASIAFEQYRAGKVVTNVVGCLVSAIAESWKPNFTKKDQQAHKEAAIEEKNRLIAKARIEAQKLHNEFSQRLKEGYRFEVSDMVVRRIYPTRSGFTTDLLELTNPDTLNILKHFIETNQKE